MCNRSTTIICMCVYIIIVTRNGWEKAGKFAFCTACHGECEKEKRRVRVPREFYMRGGAFRAPRGYRVDSNFDGGEQRVQV